MARILVTGGSGLIGTAIIPDLKAVGSIVETLDIRGNPDWNADITDKTACQRIDWSRYDGVIHLAAVSRVITAQKDPQLTWRTNVEAVLNLFDILKAQEQPPWFLFASSREVYGQANDLPVRESAQLNPLNYYGYSKAFIEQHIYSAVSNDLRCQVLRFSNVYGSAGDHIDRVVPKFMRAALDGKPLFLEGRRNTFDFTHIADVAKAVALVVQKLNADQPLAPALNIATGVPNSLGDLSLAIEKVLGQRVHCSEKPERDFDVSQYVGSTELLEQTFGWKPSTSLVEGLTLFRDELVHACQA